MRRDAERGDLESSGEAERGREHRASRTNALEPRAKHRGRESEEDDRKTEYPADGAELPIVRRRRRASDQPRERKIEHTERVRLPNREMNRERRGWNEPSREALIGDGVTAIEKGHGVIVHPG